MGQYHKVYNLDKKEFINGHNIKNGLKLLEQIGHEKSTSTALFLLLANSNGRGGGDATGHKEIGRWAGDRIVIQGDYAEPHDTAFIDEGDKGEFREISDIVNSIFDSTFAE